MQLELEILIKMNVIFACIYTPQIDLNQFISGLSLLLQLSYIFQSFYEVSLKQHSGPMSIETKLNSKYFKHMPFLYSVFHPVF